MRMTRPPAAARGCCAASGTVGASAATASSVSAAAARCRRSGIELAEILGIELLEVLLEPLGVEGGIGGGFIGLDSALVEQAVAGEDRRVESEREGDAVARSRVHLEDLVLAADEELREVGVLLHRADHHPPEIPAESYDHLLEEVVRERPLRLHAL